MSTECKTQNFGRVRAGCIRTNHLQVCDSLTDCDGNPLGCFDVETASAPTGPPESGPVEVCPEETLRVWSQTLDLEVTPGSANLNIEQSPGWDLVTFKGHKFRSTVGSIGPSSSQVALSPHPTNHYVILEAQIFSDLNFVSDFKDAGVRWYLDGTILMSNQAPVTAGYRVLGATNVTFILTTDPNVSILANRELTITNTNANNTYYYRISYLELDGKLPSPVRTIGVLEPTPNTDVTFYVPAVNIGPFPIGYDNGRALNDNSGILATNSSGTAFDEIQYKQDGALASGLGAMQTGGVFSLFPFRSIYASAGQVLSVRFNTAGTTTNSGIITTIQLNP
uniref:Uncharacterized protein n=1 Tax=viral metagenome TaxID=1070528 RepID=A0A6C0BNS5_9ZZZZ